MLAHEDGLLDLSLLHSSFLAHLHDSRLGLVGDDLVVFHLLHLFLDAVVVAFFKPHDFASTLFCLFNLLPGLHFFLFEKGDTVSQELCISLDAMKEQSAFTK